MLVTLSIGDADNLAAAAPKHRPRAKPAARAKAQKADPVATLVWALEANNIREGQPLHNACLRSNFKALAYALNGVRDRIAIGKEEFETVGDYAGRIARIEEALNKSRTLVVCQPLYDSSHVSFIYDADREVFTGSFDRRQTIWRDIKSTGSYVSQTAMGVSATVKSSTRIVFDVNFGASVGSSRVCPLTGNDSFDFKVPVPRAEAPSLKALGYLVFVGRLVYPFIDQEDTPGSLTLDDPIDVFTRRLTVSFDTGEISVVGPKGAPIWACSMFGRP